MHELAITESLVRIISDQAGTSEFTKVNKVRIEIGRLSTLEPESVEFCFDVVSKGTVAEGAKLEILRQDGTADCLACGRSVSGIQGFGSACDGCGSANLRITGGNSILVRDLEVE